MNSLNDQHIAKQTMRESAHLFAALGGKMRRVVEWWFTISLALLCTSLVFRFFLGFSGTFVLALAAGASMALASVGLFMVLAIVRSRRQLVVSMLALVALSLVPLLYHT